MQRINWTYSSPGDEHIREGLSNKALQLKQEGLDKVKSDHVWAKYRFINKKPYIIWRLVMKRLKIDLYSAIWDT